MKKLTFVFTFLLILGVSSSLWAYDDICWTINGWPLRAAAIDVGHVGSDSIISVNGSGTTTGVPIIGTVVYPASGNLRFSFQIIAASTTQNAVVHQLSLNRSTKNGTGYWRWFDGTAEGNSTATFVPCGVLSLNELAVEADKMSQGLGE